MMAWKSKEVTPHTKYPVFSFINIFGSIANLERNKLCS